MHCVVLTFALAVNVVRSNPLATKIFAYFDSDRIYYLRKEWGGHRQAIEHAIEQTMQETIGSVGLNVFPVRPTDLRLVDAYYHSHGQVQIIFSDMHLMELPQCWLPQVSFSLASNLLKFETPLTKMIINADYILMRNKSDIITNINQQDQYKHSPFLFQQVPNLGKVTFSVEGCILSGYVMTKLKGESVNLGHEKLSLTKCEYTMEIYKDGSGNPPIIAQYSATKDSASLEIKHFLLKPIKEEFILKLQAALFSIVNTTAIFGQHLRSLVEAQETINRNSANGLNKIVRGLNQKLVDANNDVANIDDFLVTWDDTPAYNNGPERIQLSNMVLTGLGTGYNSHTGGPYKLDKVMIGERIGYNTLQVRGVVSYTTAEEDHYKFSVEVSDFAINVDIDVQAMGEYTEGDVVGFRKIEIATSDIIYKPVSKLITGYLINELPKIVMHGMSVDLNPGLMHSEESSDNGSNRRRKSDTFEKENKDITEDISVEESGSYLKTGNSTKASMKIEEKRRSKHMNSAQSLILNNQIPD